MVEIVTATEDGLKDGLPQPKGFVDEHVDEQGRTRDHYQPVQEWFNRLTPTQISALEEARNESFRRQGITFTVYGNEEGTERTWPMDLFPRIIDAQEWAGVEQGLAQRVTALNRFLDDIYSGEQAIIHDGIIPQHLITSCTGFEREAMNVSVPLGARCVVAGIDLVRGADGVYRVLEDNLRNPSGISYVIENRAAMTKLLPAAFANLAVRSVDHYGRSLLRVLRSIAPPACGDDPTIVVLTPGIFNSAYFEHAFLARSIGVELVEGRDLMVDDHVVAMRTTRGLERVDVIYRRIDDTFLDPVVFNPQSSLGVPGLMAAARAGTVTVANAVGNGVGDDKAVYAYVPDMIRYYLDEQPKIDNVTTYLLWDNDQRAEVLKRLDQLVIKPVAESGGYGIVIGPQASDAELAKTRDKILENPRRWIAQEVVNLSRLPAWNGKEFAPRHIDLRPFVLCGEQTEVIPGGLTRVAMREGSLIVNSSQGGGSKDTWVLGDANQAQEVQAKKTQTQKIQAQEQQAEENHR
ncbi:MAG: circularly permuted type 2 ATP-grasp protein [Acidimicrobiia bacterium]|nr:circularly permuted type 2 ATP-grasp protein [Acidimicrobiia bacterium]MYC57787.1 circularly permuted type 2 ATP-grasp protein [Acidimicrobiia bacterium]MYI29804.1 circularly permuted type 2 ATP-grasp protein [Acidimicrobiia bacterium]